MGGCWDMIKRKKKRIYFKANVFFQPRLVRHKMYFSFMSYVIYVILMMNYLKHVETFNIHMSVHR